MEYFYMRRKEYASCKVGIFDDKKNSVLLQQFPIHMAENCKSKLKNTKHKEPNGRCLCCKCYTRIEQQNCLEFDDYTMVTCGGVCEYIPLHYRPHRTPCNEIYILSLIVSDQQRTSI
jgi:hypothetical protein